ncbi:polysaccharide deacetylase family protein [Pseudomonas sp. G(2018)]|uniref:polysaccharide deacetylase family protein n=1 Tax=Pseudomonas sp. G(2018) TaxID=2502242 RepID=UPI001484F7EE|nr:polysaccharide deacetylase family protein [Pseudomonas sp. G(2018)]
MAGTGWPSTAIFEWLQILLFERYGVRFDLLLADGSKLRMSLALQKGYIEFPVDNVAFNLRGSGLPCAHWCARDEGWHPVYLDILPAPGLKTISGALIEQSDAGIKIHYDLLGFVYWMLARCEELSPEQLDEHGRFPVAQSNAAKHGYLDRPLVDEWLTLLGEVISRQWPGLKLKAHAFSMRVSHDVDEPSRYAFRSFKGLVRAVGGDLLKRGDLLAALRVPFIKLGSRNRISPQDPSNTFDWLMTESERHGLISAFYFICGRTDPARDGDYEIEHPAIRALLRTIHERGHEIGLHPSYNTFLSDDGIAQEAQRLKKVCREEGIDQAAFGGRMHYLRWRHPNTLAAWEKAGMTYDSTLGYAELPGFRCGTCHEYPAFDPIAQKMLRLRIRPLIVMDVTLISPSYMGLEPDEEARVLVEKLKSACRAVGGTFTLLWHNSNFLRVEERAFYSAILERV